MENNIPEINLELTTTYVETKVLKLPNKIKVVHKKPEFGMSKECRKQFGIRGLIRYWLWKHRMRKLWIKNGR